MSSIRTFGDTVGCTPLERHSVKTQTRNGFTSIVSRSTLTELTVIFGNDRIKAGSKVYIMSDAYLAEWSKKEFTLEDKKFVLVPLSLILLVDPSSGETSPV